MNGVFYSKFCSDIEHLGDLPLLDLDGGVIGNIFSQKKISFCDDALCPFLKKIVNCDAKETSITINYYSDYELMLKFILLDLRLRNKGNISRIPYLDRLLEIYPNYESVVVPINESILNKLNLVYVNTNTYFDIVKYININFTDEISKLNNILVELFDYNLFVNLSMLDFIKKCKEDDLFRNKYLFTCSSICYNIESYDKFNLANANCAWEIAFCLGIGGFYDSLYGSFKNITLDLKELKKLYLNNNYKMINLDNVKSTTYNYCLYKGNNYKKSDIILYLFLSNIIISIFENLQDDLTTKINTQEVKL